MTEIDEKLAARWASIDRSDLSGELCETPSLINRVCERLAHAVMAAQRAEVARKREAVLAAARVRQSAALSKTKLSDKRVTEEAILDPTYAAAVDAEIEADYVKARLANLLDTLRRKAGILMTLGGLERADLEAGPKTISWSTYDDLKQHEPQQHSNTATRTTATQQRKEHDHGKTERTTTQRGHARSSPTPTTTRDPTGAATRSSSASAVRGPTGVRKR